MDPERGIFRLRADRRGNRQRRDRNVDCDPKPGSTPAELLAIAITAEHTVAPSGTFNQTAHVRRNL
jgi:hypothetical protein